MIANSLARLRGFNLRFLGLIALTWTLFALWAPREGTVESARLLTAVFVAGAVLISTWLLHVMGYFCSVRVLPRKSDLALVVAGVPTAGVLQYALMIAILRHSPIPLTEVLAGAPAAAFLVFGAEYLYEWRMLRGGRKKKIVLDLLPPERAMLIEDFDEMGMTPYVEFLDPRGLMEMHLRNRLEHVDQIVISRGAVRCLTGKSYLVRAHLEGIPIVDRRELSADLSGRIRLSDCDSWSYVLNATQQTPALRFYAQAKVLIEPIIGAALAIALSPVMLLVTVVIKLDSRGPAFYTQTRTGYLGKQFRLVKFRSMRTDSEANGVQFAKDGDMRVTRVGRFLRGTRIDELPQLWNIMRGEMSFFGPRPERPQFYKIFKEEIPVFSMRTVIRPGITGWAQVCAGYAASVEESRTKLEYDLHYIKHVSPRLDLVILIKTLFVALMGSERAQAKPGLSYRTSHASGDLRAATERMVAAAAAEGAEHLAVRSSSAKGRAVETG